MIYFVFCCIFSSVTKHKGELLGSIRILERLGYKLYGSYGTAEYYGMYDIKVSVS